MLSLKVQLPSAEIRVLRNHSSCHYPFLFFFLPEMTSLHVVNHYRKFNQIQINVGKPFFFFLTKLLVQAAISAGGWNIAVNLCEIFSSPFPSSMTVAHSYLGSLRKLRLFRAIIYKL